MEKNKTFHKLIPTLEHLCNLENILKEYIKNYHKNFYFQKWVKKLRQKELFFHSLFYDINKENTLIKNFSFNEEEILPLKKKRFFFKKNKNFIIKRNNNNLEQLTNSSLMTQNLISETIKRYCYPNKK